ncbi:hypothetical protein [Bosea sp. AS-1]|uniref:hypothetical protein n=1 Tax=Bosea sp. AS-1 TaxID=2015316 RepID=UPI0012FDE844|nr:hypothetical protein [Bosea sp. AS-1]
MTNAAEFIRNTKTGTVGRVISRYINTKTKNLMVQVRPVSQLKDAYWLVGNTEEV